MPPLISAWGGAEGVSTLIPDAAAGHTKVDIFVADPIRHDLVERAVGQNVVADTDAERRKDSTTRIAHLERNLCISFSGHTVLSV